MTNTRTHILDVGRKLAAQRGYTSVGLSELLKEADVPKGSFYHYFESKEDYGCALLEHYVRHYSIELAETLTNGTLSGRERLLAYFTAWKNRQSAQNADEKCLIVKLGAEISDLSPDMRLILRGGVDKIISRLSDTLRIAETDGSCPAMTDHLTIATSLYQIWLGASLMAHLSQDAAPFETAMAHTLALVPST